MGRRPEQTFVQRRHTDGQQVHEKMLSLANHQRNENQNYREIPPYSSTVARKIPWTEEPGRLQSMGSLRVRHWVTSLSLSTFMRWRRKWQPTLGFLHRKFRGQRSHGVIKSWTQLKWLSMHTCNPLSIVSFAIIFFHSEGCLFTLFIVSFAVQKLLSLIIFVFISITLGGGSYRILLWFM